MGRSRLASSLSVVGLMFSTVGAASAQPHPGPLAAGPPTAVSSRYVVDNAGPVLRVGNTVYVAGLSRVAPPTGSAVVISTATGRAESVGARVAGGAVRAAIPDNAGGWYIGGTFTSVGGVPRPGLAHLLSTGAVDTNFAPSALGQVRALAIDGGRLYVGGVQPTTGDPRLLPVLSALDPVTATILPIAYPPLATTDGNGFGVVALAAGAGRLYVGFSRTVGIAAYDEASGRLSWSVPGTPSESYSGPTSLALAGGRLLVGGQISTPTGPVDLEELDLATGTVVGQPVVNGSVSGIATVADTAFVLVGRRGGAGVWKLDLSHDTLTRVIAFKSGSAITTDGKSLYVANWAPVGGELRVYSLNLSQAAPSLHPLSQVTVGGNANALALQSGRLLVGGSFLGMGGVKRTGLAAFDARTGALLPWRPNVQGGGVGALASAGKTIYLGGEFDRVAGKLRHGLAAVSAVGSGKLLPWHPRLSYASISSLAVADRRVFAGGSLKPHGAKSSAPLSALLAFSARTGARLGFKPKIQNVQVLTAWHHLLLAGSGQAKSAGVTAFRVGGHGQVVWRTVVTGGSVPIVFALQSDGSRLYVGGRFSQIAGQPRTNLAALALDRSGAVLPFAPEIPNQVTALGETGYGLVFGTMTIQGAIWGGTQALGAVTPDRNVMPWKITYPPCDVLLSDRDSGGSLNGYVDHLAVVRGGLVVSGGFSWIGPPDNPAPGSLVWLR